MMNKVEYLDVLNDYLLKYYSEEESLDILRDYEEYFLNGKLDGKTEQEIILELGSPKIIVQELRAEEKNVSKKQEKLKLWRTNVIKLLKDMAFFHLCSLLYFQL